MANFLNNLIPKNTTPIIRKDLPFKLNIPADVQKKIDLLCLKINNIEWSGSLFYTVEGSWKENNLVINVLDFFLQDIGNAGSTTFEQTPDVVRYRMDHDLLHAYMGLIHSHHNMKAFFSGVDMDTLAKEALDHNHFVSLVVNNVREYVAAITIAYETDQIKQVKEIKSYTTFSGIKEVLESEEFEEKETIKKLEYSYLEINIEDYENSNMELLQRIEEVKKEKNKMVYKNTPNQFTFLQNSNTNGAKNNFQKNINPTLFSDIQERQFEEFHRQSVVPVQKEVINAPSENIPTVFISDDVIEYKAKQIITLAKVIPKENNISIKNFIKAMPTLFAPAFSDMNTYSEFISFFIDDIIVDKDIIFDPKHVDLEEEEITYYLASEILSLISKEITDNNNNNPYLEVIIDELTAYTITVNN